LFLGTEKDNSDDKFSKGRQKFLTGESHPNHKLTDQYNKPLEDISGSLNEWLEIE
jgi:hypothetical protein